MSLSTVTTQLFVRLTTIFCVFAAFAAISQPTHRDENLHIEPAQAWILDRSLDLSTPIPADDVRNGVYYRLVDNQIKVDDTGFRTSYTRYIETILNQTGVEESSQINIDFDPLYQKLVLNSLVVIRDGQRFDRTNSAQMSVFSRETELENQIYNGRLTLNILLDDIQPGDTLDYSYTRHGHNPIYQNIFSYKRTINWSVPLEYQHVRVLWGKPSSLNIETRNISPEIETRQLVGYKEYQVNMHNEALVKVPSESPGWFSPFGTVHFNEPDSWADVVALFEPMYQFGPLHPEVQAIADSIRVQTSSVDQQIIKALKYTQERIRYVGIEWGVNSHQPTAPEETLALKYGDCKDKAVLFIAILKALQIDAYPALVNTEDTKLLAEYPAGVNLFNHVIVWLEYEGESVWLDPTLSHQDGSLANIYQPDYGFALVLNKGQDQLKSMLSDGSNSISHVSEYYSIPADHEAPVKFNVKTEYQGYEAMNQQWRIEDSGKAQIAEDYEVYYQRAYPSLKSARDLEIITDSTSGVLKVDEYYEIETFWKMGDEHWEADFYPTDIRQALYKPKNSQRNAPLAFRFPNNLRNTLELRFEEKNWDFKAEEFVEDNPYFLFTHNVRFEDSILTIEYLFKSKTDHIPADQVDQYLEARKRARDEAYYGIIKYVDNVESSDTSETASSTSTDSQTLDEFDKWMLAIATIYILLLAYIIVDWRLESKRRPAFENNHFYPIAVWKFAVLSVVTIGLYDVYWMYRNWESVKRKNQSSIMPIARGIFAPLWLYPLFEELKSDSEKHFQKNLVVATWLGVILTILYFLINLANNLADTFPYSHIFILSPLVLLPFVVYINKRNSDEPEAYKFNSHWRIRHYLTILIFAPLVSLSLLQMTPLLPSENVVTESNIMERDMKFFYRQQLLPTDETITYFYSSAFLDLKSDGNGFTDNRVFSYWKDDNDQFQKEVATFTEVAGIDVKYSEDEVEETIITITRHDATEFMLFVTPLDDDDQMFVKALKESWNKHKDSQAQ